MARCARPETLFTGLNDCEHKPFIDQIPRLSHFLDLQQAVVKTNTLDVHTMHDIVYTADLSAHIACTDHADVPLHFYTPIPPIQSLC